MILDLLDQEDFEDLPEESGPRWVALEKLARTRLIAALNSDNSKRTEKSLKLQYMEVVTTLAGEAGIQGIGIPSGNDPAELIDIFMVSVQSVSARIWMGRENSNVRLGMTVSAQAKSEMRTLITEIRDAIPKLSLTNRQRTRLTHALEAFSNELEMPKARFSIGSGHLVAALTVLNLGVTTAAAGPEALDTIQKLQFIWGEQREEEDAKRLQIPYELPNNLLPSPPKQISGPKTTP